MNQVQEILSILGFILRALGFVVLGFGVGKFTMDAYKKAVWQVQIALSVGFFLLLVGLTKYASAGSMGMFAFSAGASILISVMAKPAKGEEETKKD